MIVRDGYNKIRQLSKSCDCCPLYLTTDLLPVLPLTPLYLMSPILRAAARSTRALMQHVPLRATRFVNYHRVPSSLLKLPLHSRGFAVSCVRSTESLSINSLDTFTEEEEMLRESGSHCAIFVQLKTQQYV